MRLLHYVGPGEDRDHLIVETADGDERFSLSLDDEARASLRTETLPVAAVPAHAAPESPVTAMSPREIQIRVRAGAAPQSLADETGMTLDRVMRFAAPVLAERSRIADEARRGRARRSGAVPGDMPMVIFGEAVDARFAAHGIDPTDVLWDAQRREDGQWIVSAVWTGGAHERRCAWAFTLSTRSVSPLDDTASDLLSDRPIRPIETDEPLEAPVRIGALGALSRLSEPTDQHPQYADAGEPATESGPTDDTGPLPRVVTGRFGQSPYQPVHADRPDQPDRFGAPDDASPAPIQQPGVDQPLPLQLADLFGGTEPAVPAPAARRAEDDEARAARARIPSWDDILMGVRRKHD